MTGFHWRRCPTYYRAGGHGAHVLAWRLCLWMGASAVCVASPEPSFGSCFPSLSSLYTMQSDLTFPGTLSVLLQALPPCDGQFEEKGVWLCALQPLTFRVLARGSPKSYRAASWETPVSWNHIDTGYGDVWQALLLPVSSLVPPSTGRDGRLLRGCDCLLCQGPLPGSPACSKGAERIEMCGTLLAFLFPQALEALRAVCQCRRWTCGMLYTLLRIRLLALRRPSSTEGSEGAVCLGGSHSCIPGWHRLLIFPPQPPRPAGLGF